MTENDDIPARLQLINTEGIGPVGFKRLLARFGSAEAALRETAVKKKVPSRQWAEEELERVRSFGAVVLSSADPRYPRKLSELDDAPPLLYVKGNTALLNHRPAVAVVGTRNATIIGRKLTSKISFELTENDVLIVSGMARGIDAAAHKGAMYAKERRGPTIAVLGTGIDRIYPPENEELYHQIGEQGLLVSEYPMGTNAQSGNFPRRNRIVAALSEAVLVAEATGKSGSLITARMAADRNRLIFAIPGSPGEARSEGPNSLLRRGALWAENAADILNVLNSKIRPEPLRPADGGECDLFTKPLDNLQKTADIPPVKNCDKNSILAYLSAEGTDTDEIIRSSGLDAPSVAMLMIELEMEDKIIRLPGNKIALTGKNMKVRR